MKPIVSASLFDPPVRFFSPLAAMLVAKYKRKEEDDEDQVPAASEEGVKKPEDASALPVSSRTISVAPHVHQHQIGVRFLIHRLSFFLLPSWLA